MIRQVGSEEHIVVLCYRIVDAEGAPMHSRTFPTYAAACGARQALNGRIAAIDLMGRQWLLEAS